MPIDLENVGRFLKEQREMQGLSVSDISDSLCLRKSLITAIESGNWALLPHEVYVKGYLKEYAHRINVYDKIINDLVHEETKPLIDVSIQQKIKAKQTNIPKKALIYPLALVLVVGFIILSQIYKEQPSSLSKVQNTESTSVNVVNSTTPTDRQRVKCTMERNL